MPSNLWTALAGGSEERFEFVLQELLSELELKKGLKFTLKEEPKTAVKLLFGEKYLVAVLCNVRIPLILPLVKKSHGLKPGRAGPYVQDDLTELRCVFLLGN